MSVSSVYCYRRPSNRCKEGEIKSACTPVTFDNMSCCIDETQARGYLTNLRTRANPSMRVECVQALVCIFHGVVDMLELDCYNNRISSIDMDTLHRTAKQYHLRMYSRDCAQNKELNLRLCKKAVDLANHACTPIPASFKRRQVSKIHVFEIHETPQDTTTNAWRLQTAARHLRECALEYLQVVKVPSSSLEEYTMDVNGSASER